VILTRRNLFGLIAAPAVIRVAQLMPISAPKLVTYEEVNITLRQYGMAVIQTKDCMLAQRTMNRIQREMMRALDDELTAPLVDAMEKFRRNPIKFRRPRSFALT
jgi:hypothetical protein